MSGDPTEGCAIAYRLAVGDRVRYKGAAYAYRGRKATVVEPVVDDPFLGTMAAVKFADFADAFLVRGEDLEM